MARTDHQGALAPFQRGALQQLSIGPNRTNGGELVDGHLLMLIPAEHREHGELVGAGSTDVPPLGHEVVDDPLPGSNLDAERTAFVRALGAQLFGGLPCCGLPEGDG